MHTTRSGLIIRLRYSRHLFQRQDGYFLCFVYVRMDTINPATAMIIINSSYVLISTTPSVKLRTSSEPPLLAALVSILYCQCSNLVYKIASVRAKPRFLIKSPKALKITAKTVITRCGITKAVAIELPSCSAESAPLPAWASRGLI